ncbi:MAG TPA: hypothetical protein PL069_00495 [Saprospiraceae bacterium]|nr:hypothetical protein [Candidatus Parvibacillus calidus]HQP75847.1 hypothetical protein [Saprospiraceae bacterium]
MRYLHVILLLMILGLLACQKNKPSQEDIIAAEAEMDTIRKIITEDSTISKAIIKDKKVEAKHKEDAERINKEIEKSPLKDLPCEKIIAEFRISVDKYCTGKITQEEMIASIPDLQDTKVKVCINNLFQEELDKINAKLEKCLESKGD